MSEAVEFLAMEITDKEARVQLPPGSIAILRADLPEVTPERPGFAGYVEVDGKVEALRPGVEWYDAEVRRLLAIREYVATREDA